MADDTTRTSNRRLNTGSSAFNAISFMIETQVKNMVNTAIPVRVDSCTKPGVGGAAGYVSATPLVMQRGADGNSLTPVSLPRLPFFRLQCGTAAVVIDPQPGDVGLAIFSQQDASGLEAGKSDPVKAGSFRSFDMADGFYVGGFLGQTPTTYVELDPINGRVNIKAPDKVTIDTPTLEIMGSITMKAQNGGDTTATLKGTLNASDDLTANGISLNSHKHSGVLAGSSDTEGPK